jgi:uncharacterized RDD family membrane protein YckC
MHPLNDSNVLEPSAEQPSPAYASFSARVRALIIDAVVAMSTIIGVFLLMALAENWRYSGQVGVVAFAGFLLLYEPVLVAMRGATIGHRRANIRVVSLKSGGNPSFLQALVRYWVKGILGLLSFATMALTRRHQAVHDRLTRTTVQVMDLSQARDSDVVWERAEAEWHGLPPRSRRVLAIVSYSLAAFVVMTIALSVLLSEACLVGEHCTRAENLLSSGLAFGWLAATVAIIIYGWRGRLWGSRRREQPHDIHSAAV